MKKLVNSTKKLIALSLLSALVLTLAIQTNARGEDDPQDIYCKQEGVKHTKMIAESAREESCTFCVRNQPGTPVYSGGHLIGTKYTYSSVTVQYAKITCKAGPASSTCTENLLGPSAGACMEIFVPTTGTGTGGGTGTGH